MRRPTEAFNYNTLHELREAVRRLYQQMRTAIEFDMTPDELIEVIAPRDHHIFLRTGYQIANIYTSGSSGALRLEHKLSASFRFEGAKPLPPKRPERQADANPALLEKFDRAIALHVDTHKAFLRVQGVLAKLNSVCGSPTQVRFYWPAITILVEEVRRHLEAQCKLKSAEPFAKLAEQLATFRTPGSLPNLDSNLRQLCQVTGGTLAAVKLLPAPVKRKFQVVVEGEIDEPGIGLIYPRATHGGNDGQF